MQDANIKAVTALAEAVTKLEAKIDLIDRPEALRSASTQDATQHWEPQSEQQDQQQEDQAEQSQEHHQSEQGSNTMGQLQPEDGADPPHPLYEEKPTPTRRPEALALGHIRQNALAAFEHANGQAKARPRNARRPFGAAM